MAHLKLGRMAAVLGRLGVDLEDRSAEWNLAASLNVRIVVESKHSKIFRLLSYIFLEFSLVVSKGLLI